MKKWLLLALFLPFFSCISDTDEPAPEPLKIEGVRPVYAPESEARIIKALPPAPIVNLGKIYYKDATIYVNEGNLGVHVIDNTDPTNPVKKKFLQIPGCRDIAIKGDILYADNVGDLVAIDISDIDHPVELSRIAAFHPAPSQNYPELYEGYFECVEEGRGLVIGWERAILTDPKCWR